MIPIRKGPVPPDLIGRGEKHARELCAAFDASPDRYLNGAQKLMIRESIYKSDAVKRALETCHHGKCCYCEAYIEKPYAYGHVEHWRPQNSSRQHPESDALRPGYYWLAYSWDNLFWSCQFCNSCNKKDLFPLENPARRARHHGMPIEAETPSILKPDGDDDPRDHITFHDEVPEGLTTLGKKTIEVLGLDKEEHEPRRRRLQEIVKARKTYIDLMNIADLKMKQHVEDLRKFVEDAVRPEQPYSAMAAVYLEANPVPDRHA